MCETLALPGLHRRHCLTETALLHTMDSIFRSSDQGQPSLLVSLDMSAAIDTIDHGTPVKICHVI